MTSTPIIDTRELVELTQALIAIESHENAKGREARISQYLLDWYKDAGIKVVLQPVEGERVNIIASIPGVGQGPTLMLNGHLDTVPAGGMERPFDPYVKDGILHGRGACDMKGAVAAMSCVLKEVHQSGVKLDGDLYFSGVIGEETGSPGIRKLIKEGPLSTYAIVGEPTGLKIGLAHKGSDFIEIGIGGKSAHASWPEQGVNAVSFAAKFITVLEERLGSSQREKTHPLLGHPSISVGKVVGGEQPPNIIPDHCTIQFDYRYLPGESPQVLVADLKGILEELSQDIPGITYKVCEMEPFSLFPHPPLETAEEADLPQMLAASIRRTLGREGEFIGLPYWTDGSALAQNGVQTVICGPGDIARAHGPQEAVEVSQLEQAASLYIDTAISLLIAQE